MNELQFPIQNVNWKKLLDKPRVYLDLNSGSRVGDSYIALLDSRATSADIRENGLILEEGLAVDFWSDDGDDNGRPNPLIFRGIVHFDESLAQWTAVMDWNSFTHVSER